MPAITPRDTPAEDQPAGSMLTRRSGWPTQRTALLITVLVTTFMLPLDYTVVSVALRDIQRTLHADFTDLQWVINGYTLTFAAFLLTGGSLADLFGRRRLFAVGMVVFGLSSLLCGLAPNPLTLDLARAVQGGGAALMFSASLALLVQEFEGAVRTRVFGVYGVVVGLGAALGPFIGGLIINALGWRWAFLINVPVSLLMLGLTLWRVSESHDPGAKGVDWAGLVTFTLASFGFISALITGDEKGWGSPIIVGSVVGSVFLLTLFVLAEKRQSHAMFDLSLFRRPAFVGVCIPPVVLSIAFWGVFLYSPTYYQGVLGYSPLQAGTAVLPFALPMLVMGPIGGRLAARMPSYLLLSLGQLLVCLGCLGLALAPFGSTWVGFLGGSLVSGIGTGLINGQMSNVLVSMVPNERAGMASGINSTMRQFGVALGFAGLGSVLVRQVAHHLTALTQTLPGVSGQVGGLARMISTGNIQGAAQAVPGGVRVAFVHAAAVSFFDGFHAIILVGAAVALIGAVLTFILVRGDGAVPLASHPGPTEQSLPFLRSAD